MVELTKAELSLLKQALESVRTEMEQLMIDEEWFVSDCVDLVDSGLEIVYGHLGINIKPEDEEDYNDE